MIDIARRMKSGTLYCSMKKKYIRRFANTKSNMIYIIVVMEPVTETLRDIRIHFFFQICLISLNNESSLIAEVKIYYCQVSVNDLSSKKFANLIYRISLQKDMCDACLQLWKVRRVLKA